MTYSKLVAVFILVGIACLPASLFAQFDLPEPDDDEIVVIGIPPDDEQLVEYVAEVGRATPDDQYGRWYDELCPAVVGLQPDIGNYVLGTIRSVAEMTGAPLQDDNSCRVNLVVIFAADPSTVITQLQNARPGLFGEMPAASIQRMANSGETVSVATRIATRGGAGQVGTATATGAVKGASRYDTVAEVKRQEQRQRPNNSNPGEAAQGGRVHNQAEGSRVSRAIRPEFNFRLMVIDLYSLEGQTIRQLSAYTAMAALGDFNLETPIVTQASILNALHDPANAPADITDWDLAYLRGLYQTRPGRSAASQRSAIVSASRRALRTGRFEVDQR